MRLDTIPQLIAMLLLQVANLPTYQTEVGATAADLTEISQDLANLQYLEGYSNVYDVNKQAVTKIKQEFFNGKDGNISKFPVTAAGSAPFPLVADARERAYARNRRFKAAAGYTEEIGIALGIEGDSVSITPDSVLPTFEGFPAQSGYEAAVVIHNRGNSDMWKILGRRVTETKRTELTSGTGKGGSFTITPETPGKPDQLELQVQLYKNNEPYGKPSSSIYITFNP